MKEPSLPTPLPLPLPLPLPPPPLETTTVHLPMRTRIRHTSVTSSTTTTSSRSSSLSSSPSSPSPSSSRSSSSIIIPFSWEHQPGIPKNPNGFEALALPLPLPPSRHIPRSGSDTGSKVPVVSDPFVTALSECAKEGFECIPVGTGTGTGTGTGKAAKHVERRSKAVRRQLSVPAITGRFGLLDLYRCKTAISVVDAAVSLPQTGRRVCTYRVISRRNRSEKR